VNDDDTIVVIASPRGASARAIVRLSGPRSLEIVSASVDGPLGEDTYVRREARFQLPDTAPFPVTIYVMRAPKSYTREDVVEIHAFGSPPLLAAILAQLLSAGARQAEPGEFTRRAFLNGRIDLAQAEAVLGVVKARSDEEERLALSALRGGVSAEVASLRGALVALAADVEAGLDFFEDDVTFASAERQAAEIASAARAVRSILEKSVRDAVFREEVIAVIYGSANAGKSSLFNALAGDDIAIVRDTPGTTRDLLEAAVCFEGIQFILVDTAGVRAPAEIIEKIAIERTRAFVREAQAVVFVVDASEPIGPDVATLYAEAASLPHVVVLNKADKPPAVDAAKWRLGFGPGDVIETSAVTGAGLEALRLALVGFVRGGAIDLSTARFWLAARQRRCLEDALEALSRAAAALSRAEGDEIVALEIKNAIEALGRVTGEDYVEDLLDRVFSRFCLGK